LQPQWYHANTFLPLKEENLYITAKMTQKWLVPRCPLWRGSTVVWDTVTFGLQLLLSTV